MITGDRGGPPPLKAGDTRATDWAEPDRSEDQPDDYWDVTDNGGDGLP